MTDFIPQDIHRERVTTVEQRGGPVGVGATTTTSSAVGGTSMEASEMAAFEKGRMQGEMEAIRRMEAEGQLKTMGAAGVTTTAATPAIIHPDVVEINRLTWAQRALGWLGQATALAMMITAIIWVADTLASLTYANSRSPGDFGFYAVYLLTWPIALWFHTQAILNYRLFPINLSATLNRVHYVFMMACALTTYFVGFAAFMYSWSDRNWSPQQWILYFAITWYTLHALYSMARVCVEGVRPVKYETWAETHNHVTGSPEQRRDHSLGVDPYAGRTLYTAAPRFLGLKRHTTPPAGAEVPTAPGHAPRWAELPRTHAGDYFLLPRKKVAIIGYWLMGTAFLMSLAQLLYFDALSGAGAGASGAAGGGYLGASASGSQRDWIDSIALMLILTLAFVGYAAMPPRTTLVKPSTGAPIETTRRSSISHTAETRTGTAHMV